MMAYLRKQSYDDACRQLASKIPPQEFFEAFSSEKTNLQSLVDQKLVTIPRLLELLPSGTQDPTPLLYNTTCYGIGALLAVAWISNSMIQRVDKSKLTQHQNSSSSLMSDTADYRDVDKT